MTPADFLPETLIAWGGPQTFNQGLGLARRNAVLESHWDEKTRTCSGKLDVGTSWPMPVSFVLEENGTVRSKCPCRQNQQSGLICPHVLALAIYLMITSGPEEEEVEKKPAAENKQPEAGRRRAADEKETTGKIEVPNPIIPDAPLFHAEIKGSAASLNVRITAKYPNGKIVTCGAMEDEKEFQRRDTHNPDVLFGRNLPSEERARETIRRMGFQPFDPPVSSSYDFSGDLDRLVTIDRHVLLNFLGTGIPALRRNGWKVELSPKLTVYYDSLDMVVPVVSVKDAPNGAFDVGCSFELQGRPIPEQLVRGAIDRGEGYILTNGAPILVDVGAVRTLRNALRECPTLPGAPRGRVRIAGIYGAFIQSAIGSLDGADLDDDEAPDWRETCAARNRDEGAKFEPVALGKLENVLRPYQKDGVYWMRFLEKSGLSGLLADEMGLGKTLQTLTWLSLERTDPAARGKPVLVVCPTSLVRNWESEAAKFVPHLKTLVVSGSDRAALFPHVATSDLVVTSYALLQRDLDACYADVDFGVVVLDEAQLVKNRATRNAKSVKRLSSVQKLVLTGTPVENSVSDVWSIFDFLLPGYLGDYETFKEGTERPIAEGGEAGRLAQETLRRKLHPFILRRLKRDVAKDLPDKITTVCYAPLSDDQWRVYNDLLAQTRNHVKGLAAKKGFAAARFEILALLMRLRQCANHLALVKDWRERHPGEPTPPSGGTPFPNPLSGKLDVFFDVLEEQLAGGHRVLVFSQFTSMLALLRLELDARGVPYCYLDGATKDRLGECRRFNAHPAIPLFLISLHAGGTGLNLTGADVVVHVDPWWNPAVEDQATDRAHRIGQKRTVTVLKLIAEGTVEERVLALQRKKQLVIDATVGATDEAVMNTLTYDDVKAIVGL